MQSGKMSNNIYIFPKRKYFPLYSYVLKKMISRIHRPKVSFFAGLFPYFVTSSTHYSQDTFNSASLATAQLQF